MPKCPICKKQEVVYSFRPFCSKRCSNVDLAKWMNNSYIVPDERDEAFDQHARSESEKSWSHENDTKKESF